MVDKIQKALLEIISAAVICSFITGYVPFHMKPKKGHEIMCVDLFLVHLKQIYAIVIFFYSEFISLSLSQLTLAKQTAIVNG